MADFLKTYVENKPGNIVNQEGTKLGEHEGLHLYTLGQRKGIGIASPVYKEAYVVVEKKADSNELVIARRIIIDSHPLKRPNDSATSG